MYTHSQCQFSRKLLKSILLLVVINSLNAMASSPEASPELPDDKAIESTSLAEKAMPLYGNWCGANHPKDMINADDPVDLLDESCKKHDFCYEKKGYLNCDCDDSFNKELIAGLKQKQYKGQEQVYARSFHLYLNGSPCNGDHSSKVAPSRAVHNIVKDVGTKSVNIIKSVGDTSTAIINKLPGVGE